MSHIVIVGAGMAGLGTACALQELSREHTITLLEKENRPGGLCRTIEKDGFFFDQTGHLLHCQKDLFKKLVHQKIPDGLTEHKRNSFVYSHNIYTRYPFQANLYGLPPEVVTECLHGYCEAVYRSQEMSIRSFEDWILANFGSGIARHFMFPFNTNLYKRHPSELSPDCAGRFIPKPDLLQVIRGAVSDNADEKLGYNATFLYPERGGIETLIMALSKDVGGLQTNQEVCVIDLEQKKALTSTGGEFDFEFLVSTAPLPTLIKMIKGIPRRVLDASESLEHVSVLNINLGIKGVIPEKHWIYIPEDRFIFYRVGFANNFSEHMAPPGCSSIYTEISYRPGCPPETTHAVQRVISDLITMKILHSKGEVISQAVIDIPHAYVIFNHSRKAALSIIHNFLIEHGIFSIGRYGRWDYLSMEDSFMDGMATAMELCGRLSRA
jgi:protoporphyrinogen oxidase